MNLLCFVTNIKTSHLQNINENLSQQKLLISKHYIYKTSTKNYILSHQQNFIFYTLASMVKWMSVLLRIKCLGSNHVAFINSIVLLSTVMLFTTNRNKQRICNPSQTYGIFTFHPPPPPLPHIHLLLLPFINFQLFSKSLFLITPD